MRLTKIDVAEAHLISAVQLHFQHGHPASVYLLAASAREILTTIGHRTGVRTMLHGIAQDTGTTLRELINAAHEHTNFLKHADRDPQAVLSTLTEADADTLLFVAANDFGRVAKGQPIELQVYECWWLAQLWRRVSDAPIKVQPVIRHVLRFFPGIRSMDRRQQLQLGWTKLQEALADPTLKMPIHRDVVLPPAPAAGKTTAPASTTTI